MQLLPDLFVPVLAAWRESRSVPSAYGAIYWVMKNRVADPRWPNTLTEVCLQRWQFSSFNAKDPQTGNFPTPASKADWVSFSKAIEAAEDIFEHGGLDPTAGANHYYDNSIPAPAAAWLGPGHQPSDLEPYRTCSIGPFSFYNIPRR